MTPQERRKVIAVLEEWAAYSGGHVGTLEALHIMRKPSQPPQPKPIPFIQHHPDEDGFSEWVCPNPESYLMKCCDCGLVHELQFRVAKYESRPSEEFEIVGDGNLQAQFRARRTTPTTKD